MAHFAQLDENNIVTNVIVVNNEVLLDSNNIEQESIGIDFCKSLFGQDTNWIQTSYNGSFRNCFAGSGFEYRAALDAFIPPKPYNSWILDEVTATWQAPTPMPASENSERYVWDEQTISWKIIENS